SAPTLQWPPGTAGIPPRRSQEAGKDAGGPRPCALLHSKLSETALVGHLPYTLAFQILIVAVLIVRISESTRMPRPLAHPLRPLTPAEQQALDEILRAPSKPLRRHQRAQALLAVAAGSALAVAAAAAGRRVGDPVATRIRRF